MPLKQQKKDNTLSLKYYGPYKVPHIIENMVHRLELPPSSCLYPIFQVSCLKKLIGENKPIYTILS
jgi:hypothetical protein